ncbi:hypothetical protein B0H10DRAFT_2349520 [Mycena sp. CBHHK59/15]|nr:hypothetical protein B0H10DRAFT_2349520 [Mycena sp. CBHHK59/15]
MAAVSGLGIVSPAGLSGVDDQQQVRKEASIDSLNVVEMALEVQMERARAMEAMNARDAAVQHLSDAYVSLRQKMTLIEHLQQTRQDNFSPSALNEQVVALEMTIKTLRVEVASLKESSNVTVKSVEPPPLYDEVCSVRKLQAALNLDSFTQPHLQVVRTVPKSTEPEDIIKARHAILAAIPLPPDPPDDTLKPIVIPASFTLHEFLANASGSLKAALSNYRVLQELTTSWCPDREEHGYLLTPLFKCNTNPRVATAHRWSMVDVMARMSKPTECFYNKDGNWYYAGVYKAFRLEDLTAKEWEALSNETTQALVKETISGRKNTSPQNIYETSQLYAAGALKVACLALQCVGFNKTMYRAVLEQATKCALAGKWKGAATPAPPSAGLGPVGGAWNAAGEAADGIAAMSVGGNENSPAQTGKAKNK